ncbi:MAG: hypothetical protein AAF561_12525 [Planctomycetota bacterium]
MKMHAALASLALALPAAATEVVPGDDVGLAFFALTPTGTGGADELLLDDSFSFGTTSSFVTSLGNTVRVESQQFFPTGEDVIIEVVLTTDEASLIPAGTVFGTETPDIALLAIGTNLATAGVFDGLDLTGGFVGGTLKVDGLLTLDGEDSVVSGGTSPADNPLVVFEIIDYGFGPELELGAEIAILDQDGDGDISDEGLTRLGFRIRFQVIPEPAAATGLGLVALTGLLRHRGRAGR